jgi:hypothetical protein
LIVSIDSTPFTNISDTTTAGMSGTLKTPVAEETPQQQKGGNSRDYSHSRDSNGGKNTSTAGPTAAKDTTGTAGDASNSTRQN